MFGSVPQKATSKTVEHIEGWGGSMPENPEGLSANI